MQVIHKSLSPALIRLWALDAHVQVTWISWKRSSECPSNTYKHPGQTWKHYFHSKHISPASLFWYHLGLSLRSILNYSIHTSTSPIVYFCNILAAIPFTIILPQTITAFTWTTAYLSLVSILHICTSQYYQVIVSQKQGRSQQRQKPTR